MSIARSAISGAILAGGMGRRMHAQDKGLVALDGRPLVAHVIARFAPQVAQLSINANRSQAQYAAFGFPLVGDEISGFAGPLAGVHALMQRCETPWLVTVPCDSPFLPLDLVETLARAAFDQQAPIAVAFTDGQAQPVFALYRTTLLASLAAYLGAGERKIDRWTAQHHAVAVPFPDTAAFANINTPEELAAYASPPNPP